MFGGAQENSGLAALGFVGYLLGPAIVHGSHGNSSGALGSIGMRRAAGNLRKVAERVLANRRLDRGVHGRLAPHRPSGFAGT